MIPFNGSSLSVYRREGGGVQLRPIPIDEYAILPSAGDKGRSASSTDDGTSWARFFPRLSQVIEGVGIYRPLLHWLHEASRGILLDGVAG